jgi:hypothetical protein
MIGISVPVLFGNVPGGIAYRFRAIPYDPAGVIDISTTQCNAPALGCQTIATGTFTVGSFIGLAYAGYIIYAQAQDSNGCWTQPETVWPSAEWGFIELRP